MVSLCPLEHAEAVLDLVKETPVEREALCLQSLGLGWALF